MDRVKALALICEGHKSDIVARECGLDANFVRTLSSNVGRAAAWYQDRVLRKLRCKRVWIDATETFRQRGVATWIAVDPVSHLTISWAVGHRDVEMAKAFVNDLSSRIVGGVKFLDADGGVWLERTEDATVIDERVLEDTFGQSAASTHELRIEGHVDTRLWSGLDETSRSAVDEHVLGLALSALYRNFVRIDEAPGRTPAMVAGIVDTQWDVRNIAELLSMWEQLKTGPWYERLVVLRASEPGTKGSP